MLETIDEPSARRARRPRRRRRSIIAASIAFVVVASVTAYVALTLSAPLPTSAGLSRQLSVTAPQPISIAMPLSGASAVSITGAEQYPGTLGTDGILASSGGSDPRPIASITKLITSLVILDAYPVAVGEGGPTITFTEADSDLYDKYYVEGATIEPMKAGSTMSLHDALELMLVTSATNYADAVSSWAFGSRGAFLDATANWLAAHNLVNTTVVEPTGVDPENVSTPAELVAIGRLALANPVLAEIVRSPVLDVPGFERESNTNTLLGDDGVDGIKTGTLDEAGSCLLFSAVLDVGTSSPITAVGAVLGGANRSAVDSEVRAILDSIVTGFHQVPVIAEGDRLGTFTTPWGDEADAVAGAGASLLTWSDTPITATMQLSSVTTATAGRTVGAATFVAGDQSTTVPIVLDGPITEPDGWWRLTHPAELFGW